MAMAKSALKKPDTNIFFTQIISSYSSSSSSSFCCCSSSKNGHEFVGAEKYINSWGSKPKSPKEGEARLAYLRRDYAKKVKVVRKEYIHEMEMLALDKAQKLQAKKEATRVANEENRAAKAASKVERAKQRNIEHQLFRQTLLKERAAKLEYWKMKVEQVEEKKKKAKEDLRNRSSMWVDEAELEKKIFVGVINMQEDDASMEEWLRSGKDSDNGQKPDCLYGTWF